MQGRCKRPWIAVALSVLRYDECAPRASKFMAAGIRASAGCGPSRSLNSRQQTLRLRKSTFILIDRAANYLHRSNRRRFAARAALPHASWQNPARGGQNLPGCGRFWLRWRRPLLPKPERWLGRPDRPGSRNSCNRPAVTKPAAFSGPRLICQPISPAPRSDAV